MTRIAAVLAVAAVLAGGGAASLGVPGDIYVVSSTGGVRQALTTTPEIELQPALSPGGQAIAYLSRSGLRVMRVDGTGSRPIGTAAGERPQWAPVYRSLAYTGANGDLCYPPPAQRCVVAELWRVQADGSGQQKLSDEAAMHPVWSPRGRSIAFREFIVGEPGAVGDLIVMSPDGSNRRTLYRSPPSRPDGDGISALPSWSPDGKWIAFASDSQVYLVKPDGSRRHWLTEGTYAAWSPRGSLIAFERSTGIWVMPWTGGRARRVSRNGQCPTWSPDGRRIAYLTTGSSARLEVARPDGRGRKVLAAAVDCYSYGWAEPSPPVWSHDGRRIYFVG